MSETECDVIRACSAIPVRAEDEVYLKWMQETLEREKPVRDFPVSGAPNSPWHMMALYVLVNYPEIVNNWRFARVCNFRLARDLPDPIHMDYGVPIPVRVKNLLGPEIPVMLDTTMTNLEMYEEVLKAFDWPLSGHVRISVQDKGMIPFTGDFADCEPEPDMVLYVTLF